MDACPTGAITAPYQLDARLCISYLTIEHKGPIPPHLRPLIGEHLYGCDDCLDACPWNRWAQLTREARFAPRPVPDLRVMLAWTEDDFAAAFAGSPIKRIGLARWLRNVCVVLGNTGTPDDLPALRKAAKHTDPLVAEHAAWAVDTLCAKHRLQEGGASTEESEHPGRRAEG
jgi:epoxyqueuosine reductase